jgi:GH25 family lysozyme M1 (1,4-beta-N-acetylmuramidase)
MSSPLNFIDVSHNNNNGKPIDWAEVKASGKVDGVFIRAGYGQYLSSQIDKQFENNLKGVIENDIPYGIYWYSYAKANNTAAAKTEAQACLKVLNGREAPLGIYFDFEDEKILNKKDPTTGKYLSDTIEGICEKDAAKKKLLGAALVDAFCKEIRAAGYEAGLYSFDSAFATYLTPAVQTKYPLWVARVENVKPTSVSSYICHQYSWKGKIPGIAGDVDLNYYYGELPADALDDELEPIPDVVESGLPLEEIEEPDSIPDSIPINFRKDIAYALYKALKPYFDGK